jgi:two-component system, sensor histidine kinase LadS
MDDIYVYFDNRKLALSEGREYVIGRDPGCDILLDDPHVSRRHASLRRMGDGVVLTDLGSLNGTWHEGKRIGSAALRTNSSFRVASSNLSVRTERENLERKKLDSGDTMMFEKQIAAIMDRADDPELEREVGVLRRLYNRKKEKLAELAFYDALTGAYNRRYFDEKIREEVSRALRYERSLSLLMIDIDHFKKVNDDYGHQKGDQVLAAVAGILKGSLRGTDIVCRYGGEEIAVILPETSADNAWKIGENCRKNIAAQSARTVDRGVTVSIGVSELVGIGKSAHFIKMADLALYRAKKNGRNQVVLFEPGMVEDVK